MPRPFPQQDELLPEEMDYIQSLQSPSQPQPEFQPDEVGDALQAFDAAHAPPPVVDPWEELAPKAPETPEVAQPFPMEQGSYGPQTSGQMASPEAPVYVPPAPPKAANAKAAYSATDSPNELFGHEAPRRNVDAEMGQLESLIGQRGPGAAPVHDNEASYDADYSDNDKRAQIAYVLNYLAGGPEQANKFQQMYDQKKAQHRAGLAEARTKDLALTQQNAPISDAQAQMLVRVYRISPQAASRLTQGEFAKLQPTLNSTGYVGNKDQSTNDKYTIEQWKLIQKELQAQEGNAADTGQAMIKGQNALAAVKANKKGGGGGGPAGPDEVLTVLASMENIQPEEAAAALAKVESGEPASSQLEAQIMNTATMLKQMTPKEFMDARKSAAKTGVMGRANREFATDDAARGKKLDADKRTKLRTVYSGEWAAYRRAAEAFKTLNQSGKIGLLVKVPYGGWNAWINTNLSPDEQDAARAISAFVNPEMRKQTGAAMSEFEKSLSFTQYGITDKFSPSASPSALGGWLKGAGQDLQKTRAIVGQEYGFDPLTGEPVEGVQ